jgi:hypothetical protein
VDPLPEVAQGLLQGRREIPATIILLRVAVVGYRHHHVHVPGESGFAAGADRQAAHDGKGVISTKSECTPRRSTTYSRVSG